MLCISAPLRINISISMVSILIALVSFLVFVKASPTSHRAGSRGCGKSQIPGFHDADDAHSIQSGNLTRYYGINVPSSYAKDPNTPRRVVFDYHGNNGTPRNQWNNSRYFAYPQGEEYLAVYPAGVNESWQSAPYAVEGVNDLQFTSDLLAHLREEYCVDNNHVYASGKSNGGGFVDFLACSPNGDEFAAFGMAAAALYSDNSVDQCNATRPRAILESHGMNDTTIPYRGGPRGKGHLPEVRTWIGWWAERDGCKAGCQGCQQTMQETGYEIISYSCGGYHDIVQHYDVSALGHCWPSSSGSNSDSARSYCYDRSLDYTPIVLDFFERWSLNDFRKSWSGWLT